MRVARALGLQTFALWRLGSEDDSLWKIWDAPAAQPIPSKTSPTSRPARTSTPKATATSCASPRKPAERPPHRHAGRRRPPSPPSTSASSPRRWTPTRCPTRVTQYGYQPKQVALTFDDGPDPDWTPKILDILKKYNVKGTFFMIGEDAAGQRRRHAAGLPRRPRDRQPHLHAPGHQRNLEHARSTCSSTSPSASSPPSSASSPLYFRPPYSIDQEPDTNDQAAPDRPHPEPRLRHRRQQDRHQRLGRASAQDPRRRSSTASSQQIADMRSQALDCAAPSS